MTKRPSIVDLGRLWPTHAGLSRQVPLVAPVLFLYEKQLFKDERQYYYVGCA